MDNDEGGVVFVNCIGSDISLWKKGQYDETFEFESCLLYDEPEYHVENKEINSTWKFFDHITKRYLVANGENEFHYKENYSSLIKVEIKTPMYALKELCLSTIATRLLCNGHEECDFKDLGIPKMLIIEMESYLKDLNKIHGDEDRDEWIDWTVFYENEYKLQNI
ncbi:uncharacterized protein LOC112685058 [Sipha flava]|jgi:hypothetical protein|uniref:Uncharacterized protein LOC112685058 n=1 Tax=Sipha flava TaxID=143950 RepID=A0A8B8FQ19_9HEMI|nr:uncharacterized protein LOC112685058 [Sipha flava]